MSKKVLIGFILSIVGLIYLLLSMTPEKIDVGDCIVNPKDKRYNFFVIKKEDQEVKALYYSTEKFFRNYKNVVKITLNNTGFKRTLCPRKRREQNH